MKKKIMLPLIVSFFALTSCNGTNQEESKFTVTWKNHDGTVLEVDEEVSKGTDPSFDSATPLKESDDEYLYFFYGWTPALSPVIKSITYTALFESVPNTIDHAYDLEYFLAIYRTSFADVRAITTTGQGEYMWHNTDDYYSVALIDEKQDVTSFYEKEMYEGVTQIEKWVIGEKEYYLDSVEGATVWPRGQLTLTELALRSLPTPLALFGIPLYLELEKEMTFELEFRVTYSEKGNLFILEMFEGEDAEAGLYYYYIENGRFSKTEGDLPYNIENNYFYDLSDIPESPPLPDIEWNEVFATDLIR